MLESFFKVKVVGVKACNCIKKRLQHRPFPVNIAKKKFILKNICKRQLLSIKKIPKMKVSKVVK